MIEIYTLSHPISKEVRYVGKANNAGKRLKSHLRDARRRKTPVYEWINELSGIGLIPIIQVIKTVDEHEWKETEIKAIEEYQALGFNLLNVAKGGSEPFCSTKQREENGRNVALSIHSNVDKKRLWSLKQKLACNLSILRKYGRSTHADEIVQKLAEKGIYV